MHATTRRAVLAVIAIGAGPALVGCDPPPPTAFTVDSSADVVDAALGDGTCATVEGACTLRAAVGEAGALAEPAEILLASSTTYVLGISGSGEDQNVRGDLDVTVPLTIRGRGSTIDGNRLDRVLDTHGAGRLVVEDLTIRGGYVADDGGGVRGEITALRSSVTGNESRGFSGCVWAGEVPTEQPLFCEFHGVGGGGVAGRLVAIHSTISGNRSTGPKYGCGANTAGPPLYSCVVSGGGGVLGEAVLVSSTISGNRAESGVGRGVLGRATAHRSTVVDPDLSGATFSGSASFVMSAVDTVSAACAAVPSSPAVVPQAPPDNGTFTSAGSNAASLPGCGLTAATDQTGGALLLGALADNGGATPTHLPALASPLIDAVPPGVFPRCETSAGPDQRGMPRPSGAGCDIGAVERQPTDP